MEKQKICSIRKGSVQWNEEDRLQLATMLIKCGYAVRIGRQAVARQRREERSAGVLRGILGGKR